MGEFLWGGEGLELSVRKAVGVNGNGADAIVELICSSRIAAKINS